jgi:hypothetical protein
VKINMKTNVNRFRSVFQHGHIVLPVVHVETLDQALINTGIARDAGVHGVFLINHSISPARLLEIHGEVARAFSGFWIGVNCLGWSAAETIFQSGDSVAGVWSDNAMVRECDAGQPDAEAVLDAIRVARWPGLYFGGVAFKYQRQVDDLAAAAAIANRYMDVVTTSGSGTGHAAHVDKIATMKAALGDFPLAIASGITPENVTNYLPHSDCYLVATGISLSFNMLDLDRAKTLVEKVREWEERASG